MMNKPMGKITKDDMFNWRGYLLHTYMKNGNARRVASANHFTKWLGREDLKILVPAQEHSNKIVLSEQELNDYLEASKENPFWHVIALFQVEGLLRPSEFSYTKINNLDLDNQTLYRDDTKTGNNYIILSPRLTEAIKNYLSYREPKPEYEEYLIIIPNGTYKGKIPKPFGGFINKTTKQIANALSKGEIETSLEELKKLITNAMNKKLKGSITLKYYKADIDDSAIIFSFGHGDEKIAWELSFGRHDSRKRVLILNTKKPLGIDLKSRYEKVLNEKGVETVIDYSKGKIKEKNIGFQF